MSLISAVNLTKVYGSGDTAVRALDNVSLQVEPGEFVAVMGPSGCGKSTLLHLLGGLDRPTSGSVTIDGHNLTDLSDAKLTELRRHKIGFIFQFFNLIPVLNSVENAALPVTLDGVRQSEARERATDWLRKVGLDGRLDHRPDQLSGGQQQRVAVARALANQPSLILADEPTAALDSVRGRQVMELFRKVAHERQTGVIVVTHDHRSLDVFDRTLEMEDGLLKAPDGESLRPGATGHI